MHRAPLLTDETLVIDLELNAPLTSQPILSNLRVTLLSQPFNLEAGSVARICVRDGALLLLESELFEPFGLSSVQRNVLNQRISRASDTLNNAVLQADRECSQPLIREVVTLKSDLSELLTHDGEGGLEPANRALTLPQVLLKGGEGAGLGDLELIKPDQGGLELKTVNERRVVASNSTASPATPCRP